MQNVKIERKKRIRMENKAPPNPIMLHGQIMTHRIYCVLPLIDESIHWWSQFRLEERTVRIAVRKVRKPGKAFQETYLLSL